jgi:hypothetical protein
MTLADIPTLDTAKLEELAAAYEAAVKQYHAYALKQSCRDIAKLCREEIARRA